MITATATGSDALHPRLVDIVAYLSQSRAELVRYVTSLSDEQRAFRSAPDRWSVLDNLEHLGIVEDGCGRLFSNLVKQLHAAGSPSETENSSMMTVVDHFRVVDAPQRIVAPERLRPTGQQSLATALDRLEASRGRLVVAIQGASGLALDQVSAPHPVFGPVHGYAWLVFVAQHELRHLRQMRDNVSAMAA